MITDENLYESGVLDVSDLSGLQESFENLPPDPYAEERLRSRRYSRYKYHADGTLERLNQKDFMQSKDINKYVGDVERHYEDIEKDLAHNSAFLNMFREFIARTGVNENNVIEAHQIRWHCGSRPKEAAPEGCHQDGFDYIGMFMVDIHNVNGGEIMLFEGPDSAPFFKKRLNGGEFVVANDRKLFHNASTLIPTENEEPGHWDVIVLTANAQPEDDI